MLSNNEISKYINDGYVTPDWILSQNDLNLLKKNIDKIILNNPNMRPEQIVCPHIKGGTTGKLKNKEHEYFLKLAYRKDITDMVTQLLGKNFILWGSQIFCKPAYDGMAIPMHQDSHYWPIEPMSTCSIWLAADKASKINGCLSVIPGSHKEKLLKHNIMNKNTALNAGISQNMLTGKKNKFILLEPGQLSIHDANIIHGSNKNKSSFRRAGIVYRYMSSKSKFNRTAKNHEQKDGHIVNYSKRPIWLIKGNKGNNTLVKKLSS